MALVLENRRARHDYEILETYEAGIALNGTEVKSLRAGKVDFTGSFARFENGELYLENLYIAPYEKGSYTNVDPRRKRKLLLHRHELNRLRGRVEQRGLTLVPLKIYFNERGYAKVLLGLARGKKAYQRKEDDKKRAVRRALEEL
uniref:SsrA-binding protein n=1 Tax=Thermus tengchongensis TaxID=1214928 RepID=A0A7V3ZZT5_9DEIN